MLFALLLLAAPASQPTSDVWLKGRIEKVGTVYTPQLNLVTDDGKRYEVVGDLAAELAGLEYAKLEVLSAREREGQLPRVRALQYKIVDIGGGDHPEIGIVKVLGDQVVIVIDAQKMLTLADTNLSRRLKSRVGEKVWVVGKPTSNGNFKVFRVGYLGVPKPASSQPTSQPASQPGE